MLTRVDVVAALFFLIVVFAGCALFQGRAEGLYSEDPAIREATVMDLAGSGREAVKPMVRILAKRDPVASAGARQALHLLAMNADSPGIAEAIVHEAAGSWPAPVRCRLLELIALAGGEECVPVLEELIHEEPDPQVREAACRALSRIRSDRAFLVMKAALEKAPPDLHVALIQGLAHRGDPSLSELLIRLLNHEDPIARLAAIEGLGKLPDPVAAPLLLKIGTNENETKQVQSRAVAAYLELAFSLLEAGFREESAAMFERMLGPDFKTADRCAGLSGLVKAEPQSAVARLKEIIKTEDRDLAGLAVDLLSHIQGEEITLAMAEVVDGAKGPILIHLIHALTRRQDRAAPRAMESILSALEKAPSTEKPSILKALGDCREPALLETFLQATYDQNEDVVIAALAALALLGDASALPRIQEIAENGRQNEKAAAVQAYIGLGETMMTAVPDKAQNMFEHALNLADEDDGKIQALTMLGKLGGRSIIALIRPFIEPSQSEAVRAAAARALAEPVLEAADPEILKNLVEHGRDANAVQKAAAKLGDMGYDISVPVREGCIAHFWVIGPFPGRSALKKTDPVSPELPVDLDESVVFEGASFPWSYHRLDHIHGMLDLLRAVNNAEDVGAYVYAEVVCPDSLEAIFKFGSDDDLYCWLNNERIHGFEGGRGWSADQDAVEVVLKQGTNTILMKVLNGGGGWAVSLCITDRDGLPLDLKQREMTHPTAQ